MSTSGLLSVLFQQVNEVLFATAVLNQSGLKNSAGTSLSAKWKPPDMGWLKLNSDGACQNGGNLVAAGGDLRDCSGKWIAGFCHRLSSGDM